ncbi:MAG: alkyl hydroperoxide reductase subunit F [Zoogloeaceae bacterium]|jgi:alkyl hydroperoxide reductase subunit F|nr:alkyl hydroperoxide reductase subunit F [Zoogloeaceae bacterium]
MLEPSLKEQLRAYLENLVFPVEIVASLDESDNAREMQGLLEEIAPLSEKVRLRFDGENARRPSFSVARPGEKPRLHFAGLPMGHEFTSLVLALLHVGGHPPRLSEETQAQIRAIQPPKEGSFRFETFVSLSCHNCPDVVQALNTMAALNPAFEATMIEGGMFQKEIEERNIMGVPAVYLNGELFASGRMSAEEILARLDTGAEARAAEKISQKDVFDVLVVGGGPAGSAAAIYAARKGIRVGVAAERFGGQILDTLAIENFISVKETEGPRLAAALEEHVRVYGVDIMNQQKAARLVPGENGAPHIVRFSSGGELKGKTVIVATGARWREMGVPGETEYRARGVAYCPHCDGPLFKGKRVAVIGGGNSGVEAAIDLAGVVAHVTLLEFGDALRADAVLQEKLASLSNAAVIKQAQTTEVHGDGQRVTGLSYRDRASGETRRLDLEGVFVQIGLLPSTDWLKDTLTLAPNGEIVIDARGQTSLPGVFAAGDCSSVPYKQIIIAMGEGAKASLSAFDYLTRQKAA